MGASRNQEGVLEFFNHRSTLTRDYESKQTQPTVLRLRMRVERWTHAPHDEILEVCTCKKPEISKDTTVLYHTIPCCSVMSWPRVRLCTADRRTARKPHHTAETPTGEGAASTTAKAARSPGSTMVAAAAVAAFLIGWSQPAKRPSEEKSCSGTCPLRVARFGHRQDTRAHPEHGGAPTLVLGSSSSLLVQ